MLGFQRWISVFQLLRAGGLPNVQQEADRPHRLYPVALDAQYKILCRGVEIVGQGRTTWIGSKCLVFVANGELPKYGRIEVSLLWPVVLEGGVRLKLVIRGRVYEKEGDRITVAISRFEFHTRAASPLTEILLLPNHADDFQNSGRLEP